ncbi:hypothetical protein [Streptomyces chryseus]
MPIAVVRAETYYLPPPPPQGDPNAWNNVPAAERVYRWIAYRMGRRVPIPTTFDETAPLVYARINQNRWLADCGFCGSAAIVSPTDPRYGCTECQAAWIHMVFPDDPAAVEAEMLLIAKTYLRNWWHPQDPANPNQPEVPPVEEVPL